MHTRTYIWVRKCRCTPAFGRRTPGLKINLNAKVGIEVSNGAPKSKETRSKIFDITAD